MSKPNVEEPGQGICTCNSFQPYIFSDGDKSMIQCICGHLLSSHSGEDLRCEAEIAMSKPTRPGWDGNSPWPKESKK